MRCAVIYQSRWGNCKEIAESIAVGLSDTGNDVYLVDIGSVASLDPKLDCIMLGGPTTDGRAARPVRRLIRRAVTDICDGKDFAAFGTGLQSEVAHGSPQAADDIHEMLAKRGLLPLAPPFKAAVMGLRGPLIAGEADRAVQFGRDLGRNTPFQVSKVQRFRQASGS